MPLCFRNNAFSVRIVNIWNGLPASAISANNVNTLKSRLDRFWANQDLIYDYKSTLTGTGNRSFGDNIDNTILKVFITAHLMGIDITGFSLHPFLQLCFALM